MRVIMLALCMVILAPCQLQAKSAHHRPTYCTTCARDSHGRIKRNSSTRQQFLKSQHLTHTPKGCQVDHTVPLAKGGKDTLANMQLLCGEELKAKERMELK